MKEKQSIGEWIQQTTRIVRRLEKAIETLNKNEDRIKEYIRKASLPLDDVFLTTEEVLHELRISKSKLQQLRNDGLVAYYALDHKLIYRASEIIRLLEEYKVPTQMEEMEPGWEVKLRERRR